MKATGMIGACVLMAALLSGCGAKQAAQGAADSGGGNTVHTRDQQKGQQQGQGQGQGQKQADSNAGNSQGQPPQAKNPNAMQMMVTFRILIAMDKVDGLSITKDQATSLLPIVQDIISQGELSDDSKGKLTEKLSADQKKYVDNAAANVPGRPNNNANGSKDARPNGGPGAANDTAKAAGGAKGQPASNAADDRPQPNGNGAKDAAKELVALLQSKTT